MPNIKIEEKTNEFISFLNKNYPIVVDWTDKDFKASLLSGLKLFCNKKNQNFEAINFMLVDDLLINCWNIFFRHETYDFCFDNFKNFFTKTEQINSQTNEITLKTANEAFNIFHSSTRNKPIELHEDIIKRISKKIEDAANNGEPMTHVNYSSFGDMVSNDAWSPIMNKLIRKLNNYGYLTKINNDKSFEIHWAKKRVIYEVL